MPIHNPVDADALIAVHAALPDVHHARQHAINAAADHTGRIALTQMTLGGAGLVLTGQGAGDPIYAAAGGGLSTKVKLETRDMTAASGNVAYTGYGFRPKALIIFAIRAQATLPFSIGFGDSAFANRIINIYTADQMWQVQAIIQLCDPADYTKRQTAVLASLDVDGFTLTWTKSGVTAAGTAQIIVLALG